jgi:glyoxylase-like metal-dependent hydrolase (beta-lactamase superfamily II)
MKRRLAFATACLVLAGSAAAQGPDFGKMEIKAVKVAGAVYMLEGTGGFTGGNIGVSIGEDGVVLVDDKFAPLTPKIEAALKGVTDQPVRFVLNTHLHGDHTNGNLSWGKRADIIAQTNVRKRLATQPEAMPKEGLPIVTFDESLSLHVNGEEVQAIHFPGGHTDGDAVIFFTGSNVIHMGDLFFNGTFPFIDAASGGGARAYARNMEQIIAKARPDTRIIPGHGPLATLDDLKAHSQMLNESIAIVEAGVKAGKSLEKLKQEKVLAKFEAKYGGGFISADRMIEQLYNQLTAE